jgi:hypothetical protein
MDHAGNNVCYTPRNATAQCPWLSLRFPANTSVLPHFGALTTLTA